MQPINKKVEILIDSSSLILTNSAGMLPDVTRCYDLLIPSSVYQEITVDEKPGAKYFRALREDRVVQVLTCPNEPYTVNERQKAELLKMGRGERELLIHALAGCGSFTVVDDLLAARFCVRHDIPFINALLLPKILHWAAEISRQKSRNYLSILEKRGRYSGSVIKRAAMFAAMDLQQFFPQKTID